MVVSKESNVGSDHDDVGVKEVKNILIKKHNH